MSSEQPQEPQEQQEQQPPPQEKQEQEKQEQEKEQQKEQPQEKEQEKEQQKEQEQQQPQEKPQEKHEEKHEEEKIILPFELKVNNFISTQFENELIVYECVLKSNHSNIKRYLRYSDYLRIHELLHKKYNVSIAPATTTTTTTTTNITTSQKSSLNDNSNNNNNNNNNTSTTMNNSNINNITTIIPFNNNNNNHFPNFPPKKIFTWNKINNKQFIQQRVQELNIWLQGLLRYITLYTIATSSFEARRNVLEHLFGNTLILQLIKNADLSILEYLHLSVDELIAIQDGTHGSTLHYAIASNSTDMLQWLWTEVFEKSLTLQSSLSSSSSSSSPTPTPPKTTTAAEDITPASPTPLTASKFSWLHQKDDFGWDGLSLAKQLGYENLHHMLESKLATQLLPVTFSTTTESSSSSSSKRRSFCPIQYTLNFYRNLDFNSTSTSTSTINTNSKKILAFINPFAGKGLSLRYWQSIEKIFKTLGAFAFETVVTKSAGDAYTFLLQNDTKKLLRNYFMIISLGGDGTLSEIVNGIYNRNIEEREKLLDEIVFCPLPGGSSNDLSLDCFEAPKNDFLTCVQKMLLFQASTLDLIEFQQPIPSSQNDTSSNDIKAKTTPTNPQIKKELGFLGLQWGMTASVDFESEKWRFLGKTRFDLQAAIEIVQGNTYKARIYYKPVPGDTHRPPLEHQRISSIALEQARSKPITTTADTTTTTTTTITQPNSQLSSTTENTTTNNTVPEENHSNISSEKKDSTMEPMSETKKEDNSTIHKDQDKDKDTESALNTTTIENKEKKEEENKQEEKKEEEKKDEEKKDESNSNIDDNWWTQLPLNNDKPPEGWVRIEGEFGLLLGVNLNKLGGYPFAAHSLKRNDGLMQLIYTPRVSRRQAIALFGEIEKSEHPKNKNMFMFKVQELILEPLEKKPLVDFDGERRPLVPTYLKILPQRAMISY